MFYTRIPCPRWVTYSDKALTKSVRYLPLAGWIVGAFSAFVLSTAQLVLPNEISIILSMITGVLLTGAFHEDGLADVCDGFGGGWDKAQALKIMKDSRLGTYGATGLFLALILKFFCLAALLELPPAANGITQTWLIVTALVSAHSLSRYMALTTVITHRYVRDNETSKSRPVIKEPLRWNDPGMLIATVLGLAPLLLFQTPLIFLLVIPVYLGKMFLSHICHRKIDGYTGDCLGAIQQITELIFYLTLLSLWPFIS